MTKRIFRSILLVALAVMLASLVLILGMLYSYFTQVQLEQLKTETDLVAHAVTNEGSTYFQDLQPRNCRITWVSADGTVLYDSQSDTAFMENHLQREEVKEALQSGYGESARYSYTLKEQSLYAAKQLPDGTVLRLSTTHDSALTLVLGVSQPICMVVVAALVLSLLLAMQLSKNIVKPLNLLDLDQPLRSAHYEELSPLLGRIDFQQKQLRAQAKELNRRQKQFDAVTANMSEGLVLLDAKGAILSINPAASDLLGAENSRFGEDFLQRSTGSSIAELAATALAGEKAESTVSLNQKEYQITASPVRSEGELCGAVLLLFDVTEKQKAEQLRQEFTANVSHELKTPLHAISGYAELMKSGIVQAQDQQRFSENIYTEAQRLIRLVEDIIKLSRLDEGGADMRWEPVELYSTAEAALRELSSGAALANVTLSLKGDPVTVHVIPQLLRGILSNLIDNAIKYNRSGGSVTVEVGQDAAGAFVQVADTGIGIPSEYQERIFERFYRVDKSHSKEVGGTGLGLSIVKHAVLILDAKLSLSSTPGEGTTITVHFPQ